MLPGREKVEKLGVKIGPGRRESWEEGIFKIWLYFSLSYSDLLGNNIPQVKPGLSVMVIDE